MVLACGMYRTARWLQRYVFERKRLHEYRYQLGFFSNFVHADDLVFDVGANIGDKTEIFLGLGARVVAVEPQPDCMRELKARCRSKEKLMTMDFLSFHYHLVNIELRYILIMI